MGQHQGLLTAQIPPNPEGRIAELQERLAFETSDLRTRLEAFETGFGDFAKQCGEDLGFIKQQWGNMMGERSKQAGEFAAVAAQEGQRITAELKAAGANLPEGVVDDFRSGLLKTIAREPTKKQREAMGPLGELANAAMRKGMYEWLAGQQSARVPGSGGGGGNKEI